MLVYVINREGKPLMPCSPGKARRLLRRGKAKVARKDPFVIKLSFGSSGYKQEVIGGIDSGSKVIGSGAVGNGKVFYQSEISLRGEEIRKNMDQRKMYRRSRRGRKTRYRKARFLNRSASTKKGRLAPSVNHKVEAHLREKKFMEKILPIAKWLVEVAQFDIHRITNPEVKGAGYQDGNKKGFYNAKAYVLHRDDYKCQKCRAKNCALHVHHIIFRSKGGTDSPENLITLCKICHDNLHQGKFEIKAKKSKTSHATEVNMVTSQLRKSGWPFEETYGFETKLKREALGLPKAHYLDAVVICLKEGESVDSLDGFLVKRLVSKGDYQQTKGARSSMRIPTGKLFGLRKFDRVKTPKGVGFVKGKRSSGYFAIGNMDGKVIASSVNVKKDTERLGARKVVLTERRSAFLPAMNGGVSCAQKG